MKWATLPSHSTDEDTESQTHEVTYLLSRAGERSRTCLPLLPHSRLKQSSPPQTQELSISALPPAELAVKLWSRDLTSLGLPSSSLSGNNHTFQRTLWGLNKLKYVKPVTTEPSPWGVLIHAPYRQTSATSSWALRRPRSCEARAGPREAAARPGLRGLCLPAVLAPGPGLRSPHSALLSTQQNKLFQGKVVPLEKCSRTSCSSLPARRQRSARQGWAPPCTTLPLKSASC